MSKDEITPELILNAYAAGFFPMAESRNSERIDWYAPKHRGIIFLDEFYVPRRLRRTIRNNAYTLTADRQFDGVINGCAEAAPGRENTWINQRIIDLYTDLHRRGYAHSIECWDDDRLIGGVYGVAMGAAFFGESMFSRRTNASKIALVWLAARLKAGHYLFLDTQFLTQHLEQFGARAISHARYQEELSAALCKTANFYSLGSGLSGDDILQLVTQTS